MNYPVFRRRGHHLLALRESHPHFPAETAALDEGRHIEARENGEIDLDDLDDMKHQIYRLVSV